MSFLDVLLRKVVQVAGVSLTERKYINFVSGATAVDNSTTGATDITITSPTAPAVSVGPTGSGAQFVTTGTNDDVQINAAISYIVALGGGLVQLLPGTYFVSAPITLQSGVSLRGAGAGLTKIKVTSSFSNTNFYVVGAMGIESSGTLTTSGTAVPLTSNALIGTTTLTFASTSEASTIAVGDYVFVTSDALWETTNDSGRKVGEYAEVLGVSNAGGSTTLNGAIASTSTTSVVVTSAASFPAAPFTIKVDDEEMRVTAVVGTTLTVTRGYNNSTAATHLDTTPVYSSFITVSSYMRDDYKTADTAKFYRVTFVTDVHVSDIDLSQQPALDTLGVNTPALIGFTRVRRATVSRCRLHDYDSPGITIYQSLDVTVTNCAIDNLTNNVSAGRLGYGILTGGASERVSIIGNTISKCRHAIDAGPAKGPSGVGTSNRGIPRGVAVVGNAVSNVSSAALSTHSEADGWLFEGNHVSHCNDAAINMRGRGCRIIGNSIEWCGQGINIGATSYTDGGSAAGSHVIGNSIRYMKALSSSGAVGVGITVTLTDKCLIKGNTISECDRAGIQVRQGVKNCAFVDNVIQDCNLSGSSGSISDAISLDTNKSGTTATIAFSAGTCTLTKSGANFTSDLVGRTITISGSGTPGNNGTFTVLAYTNSTTITYTNASGANSAADVTYAIESIVDNVFEGNTARNTPASSWARGSVGLIASLIRDYGGANGNMRNIYRNNTGYGLTATSANLIRTNGATYFQDNNQDATAGLAFSGNEKQTVTTRLIPATVQTTNATVTTLDSFTIASGTVVTVTWTVTALDSTFASGAGYSCTATFKNNAGTVAQVGTTVVTVVGESVAGWDATIDNSTTTIRLRVTGAAATTIRWGAVGTVVTVTP